MTSTTKILSYAAILDYLKTHNRGTSSELRERLAKHELPNSESTFERLKNDLKNFGVFLKYQDGYYLLDIRDNPHQSTFFHLINLAKEVSVFQYLILDANAQQRILLESVEPPKFYELLTPIFNAITQKKSVKFDYNHYFKGKSVDRQLNPYLLTQYKRRWYVIGYSEHDSMNLTFALDRMENLEVLTNSFVFNDHLALASKVSQTVGINYSQEPIDLSIKAYAPQNSYLLSLPLHDNQVERESGEGYTIFDYHIRPNYELEQELMKISDQISVIKPVWLRDKISNRLSAGIERNS
jgi:predicted DNA-binding transcriptional regulator YafY